MNRNYKCNDVTMLSACDIMCDTALENNEAVEASNSALTSEYFTGMKTNIGDALSTYFGIDSGAGLHALTREINTLQASLLRHLTIIHTQVESAYKKDALRRADVLKALGFTTWWVEAKRNGSQVGLISLLEVFEKGCTADLADELMSKKVSDTSLNFVKDNMRRMYELNVRQESHKTSRKNITKSAVESFNAIYDETMLFAGGLKVTFNDDPILKKAFTFSHVIKLLGSRHKPGDNDPDAEAGQQ